MQGKTLLYTEILSCELDLQVKSLHEIWEAELCSCGWTLDRKMLFAWAEAFSCPVRVACKPTWGHCPQLTLTSLAQAVESPRELQQLQFPADISFPPPCSQLQYIPVYSSHEKGKGQSVPSFSPDGSPCHCCLPARLEITCPHELL